jgi:hypothetical protein
MKGWKDIALGLIEAYFVEYDEDTRTDKLIVADFLKELILQFKEVYEIEDDVEDDWVMGVRDIRQLIWELEK